MKELVSTLESQIGIPSRSRKPQIIPFGPKYSGTRVVGHAEYTSWDRMSTSPVIFVHHYKFVLHLLNILPLLCTITIIFENLSVD